MKSKSNQMVKRISKAMVIVMVGLTACLKLVSPPQLTAIYAKMGLADYMQVLGIVELFFLVLFILPRTMKIGFLFLTGYFGGAMAVEFSHGALFIFPTIILSLVWISAYLRDGSIFCMAPSIKNKAALIVNQ